MVYKHELLVIAVIMIIVGGVVWGVDFPPANEAAANAAGQVIFWIGIVFLIIWAALVAIYYAQTHKT